MECGITDVRYKIQGARSKGQEASYELRALTCPIKYNRTNICRDKIWRQGRFQGARYEGNRAEIRRRYGADTGD